MTCSTRLREGAAAAATQYVLQMNDAGREERRVARGVPGVEMPGQLCTISWSPKSFLEPLLAALDILVEQLREVADDEGEDDRGEEL